MYKLTVLLFKWCPSLGRSSKWCYAHHFDWYRTSIILKTSLGLFSIHFQLLRLPVSSNHTFEHYANNRQNFCPKLLSKSVWAKRYGTQKNYGLGLGPPYDSSNMTTISIKSLFSLPFFYVCKSIIHLRVCSEMRLVPCWHKPLRSPNNFTRTFPIFVFEIKISVREKCNFFRICIDVHYFVSTWIYYGLKSSGPIFLLHKYFLESGISMIALDKNQNHMRNKCLLLVPSHFIKITLINIYEMMPYV